MKIHPNLPGALRFYFGIARFLCLVLAAFWLLTLTLSPWIQKQFIDEPKLMVTVGEVLLRVDPTAVGLNSDSAKPGSLGLSSLRGTLRADLISKDAGLVSTLRWTVFPSMALLIAFGWVCFGSLRNVCANLEKGEVFSEQNLRLVRGIGLVLMAYSLASLLVGFWAAHVMNGYLGSHVTLTGLSAGAHIPTGSGALRFLMPAGLISVEGGLVTGCLVLLLSEAFRQGLNLKTENDLTV